MLKLLPVLAVAGLVTSSVNAADMPVLRGSYFQPPVARAVNWDGVYAGGHAGQSASSANHSSSTRPLLERMLSHTLVEQDMGVSGWPVDYDRSGINQVSYGAFVGYNTQWDDVVYGLEATYNHGKFGGGSSGAMARRTLLSDGNTHNVALQAASFGQIRDYGTFRARAGYAIGSLLPYMFGGVAFGSADLVRRATVNDYVEVPPPGTSYRVVPLSDTIVENGKLVYGYTAGIGVDVNLLGGLFMRGEYEYTRFVSSGEITVNTIRGGLGYKF